MVALTTHNSFSFPRITRYSFNGYVCVVVVENASNYTTGMLPFQVETQGYSQTIWVDSNPVYPEVRSRRGKVSWFSADGLFPLLVPRPHYIRCSCVAASAPWRPTWRACPPVGRGRSRWRGVFPKRWRGRRKRRSTC